MEALLAIAFLIGISLYAKQRRNKHYSKTGTGGAPVYDYKCPKCGYEFNNNPL